MRSFGYALFAVIFTTLIASAQCVPLWTTGGGLPGVDGQVQCSTVWNHGGSSFLVVGGVDISIAGDAAVHNLAAFDGASWQSVGSGVDSARVMTTYNGELIVASASSAQDIRAWNGQSWRTLGAGVHGAISAMTVYNGELIVGGNLSSTVNPPLSHLARWNGSTWRTLGAEPQGVTSPAVKALAVYNNELIVGGRFTAVGSVGADHVARWNGAQWRPLSSGVNNQSVPTNTQVIAFGLYNNDLIAGGSFDTAGGVAANKIARWNGANWQPLGSGTSEAPLAMIAHADELFVGGGLGFMSRWNGSNWRDAGGSMNALASFLAQVSTLTEFQGSIYAGGNFTSAGLNPVNCVARWDGTAWTPVGAGWSHASGPMAVFNGEAIVQGYLNRVDDTPIRIGAWNGTSWRPFQGAEPPSFFAMTIYRGDLIGAGGTGSLFSGLWRWTGAGWQNFTTLGGGPIYALTVYNDQIIVAGVFPSSSGGALNRIASWNGSSWHALGSGLQGWGALALAVYDGDLIVGGNFDSAGGVPNTRNIARWDGTSWGTLGTASTSQVTALALYNGNLIAAGVTPPGSASTNIARWDGTSWRALGAGPSGQINSMAVFKGELICGGSFRFNGSEPWTTARWDGAIWTTLGGEVGGRPDNSQVAVGRVLSFGNELLIGGDFKLIPGAISANLAHWRCPGGNCYANCDNSTNPPILNANDFQCFLNRFATQNLTANCDGSSAPPVLNVNDFQCFVNKYAVGCP